MIFEFGEAHVYDRTLTPPHQFKVQESNGFRSHSLRIKPCRWLGAHMSSYDAHKSQ